MSMDMSMKTRECGVKWHSAGRAMHRAAVGPLAFLLLGRDLQGQHLQSKHHAKTMLERWLLSFKCSVCLYKRFSTNCCGTGARKGIGFDMFFRTIGLAMLILRRHVLPK